MASRRAFDDSQEGLFRVVPATPPEPEPEPEPEPSAHDRSGSERAGGERMADSVAVDDGRGDESETEPGYCREIADFYTPGGRFWVRDYCEAFLDEKRILPSELLHLSLWQEALDGWALHQTVLQKAATIQSRSRGPLSKKRHAELMILEQEIVKLTRERGRSGEPPALDARSFGESVRMLYIHSPAFEGRFAIDALTAHSLSGLKNFQTKLDRLLSLVEGQVPGEALVLVDQFVGELLASPGAYNEIFLWVPEFPKQFDILAQLWSNEPLSVDKPPKLILRLARFLSLWDMPVSRKGLEIALHRLLLRDERLSAIVGYEALGTSALLDELVATGVLATRLKVKGAFIGGRRTARLLDRRIASLLSEEKLEHMLRGKTYHAKLIDLFQLDQAVVGEYSHHIVTDFIQRLLDNREFSARLLDSAKGVRNKLRVMADIQQRVNKSSLNPGQRGLYSRMLDEIQHTFIRANGIFGRFAKDKMPASEEILELAGLIAEGNLTEDKCVNWGRELLRFHVRTAGFIRGVMNGLRTADDRVTYITSLTEKLTQAGAGLRDITKLRVLVAEDEDAARSYVEMILRDLGITQITLTRDGREALENFIGREDSYDLIICDWKMPRLSGLSFLKQVRTVRPALPFLMITALATLIAVEEALAHDVTAYIAKPFPPEQLEEKVMVLINRDRLH